MRTIFEIRTAKDSKETPEATIQLLSSLGNILRSTFWQRFRHQQPTLSLEIASLNQRVFFIITTDSPNEALVKSQIAAQYSTAVITAMDDYLPIWSQHGYQATGQMVLSSPHYFPLKNYTKFSDTDPISAILGVLGKTPPGTAAIIQIVLSHAPSHWVSTGKNVIKRGISSTPETFQAHPQQALIEEKLSTRAYLADIRLLSIGQDQSQAQLILSQMASVLGTYSLSEGNSLILSQSKPKHQLIKAIVNRSAQPTPRHQYLNLLEIASLYHFPGETLSGLRNIAWGKTIKGEAPDNLPTNETLDPEEINQTTFFATTEYRNQMSPFGIKLSDRRRHFYILGKSGTGKSTLIAKMAIDDLNKNRGMAVIDPHGDLIEGILLDHIPENRIQDVVYLDPSQINNPFHINPLEVLKPEYKDLTVSNIMSIFTKLWANVWSARMEYILRNTLATLVEVPGTTFLDIPRLLTDNKFRANLLAQIDPVENRVIHDFWLAEYNQYNDKFRNEAIAPILNKVGQFIASPKIRSVIGNPKSTINIENLMNTGKIVLLNLSQGKVGEENAALLGAMFITQFQLAAMNRINIPENQRRDFFLYVDEFQNFATTSFIKILSEARKYRLDLILANQYTAQLPEEIQKAIFGNVGTIAAFIMGADDAGTLSKEFGEIYTTDDLVNLGRYQIITKLSINDRISNPFPAYTLPLPSQKNDNRQRTLDASILQHTAPNNQTPTLSYQDTPKPDFPFPYPPVQTQDKPPIRQKPTDFSQVEVGKIYSGIVKNIKDYGAFVEILPGYEGLVHISNMSHQRLNHPSDLVKKGDIVKVKLYQIDDQNRLNLTMKMDQSDPSSK